MPLLAWPLLQAEETTLGPWRLWPLLDLFGVTADLGSSAQKSARVDGVMADCGCAVNGA